MLEIIGDRIMTVQVVEDKELSRRLGTGVTTQAITQMLKLRYGTGWQSALADVLGVSSKTVNHWIRTEKLPRPAQIAIGAILQNRSKIQGRWSVIRDHDGYLICDASGSVGRVVARTSELADATLIAAAPILSDALDETSWVYTTHFEEFGGRLADQDAGEEDAEFVDPGLTLLREAQIATRPPDAAKGKRDEEKEP
jgi:DNA-binding transcriptional regulator YiaG